MIDNRLAIEIAKLADDKKAKDVVIMDMRGFSTACDFFVIASATNTTQARAIADNIEEGMLESHDLPFSRKEGYREAEWVLLDYGDVVAHVFLTESREYYALEDLWKGADLFLLSEVVDEKV